MVWERHVTDSSERRIFEALTDPSWDFRTIDGIASSTGLPPSTVYQALSKHPRLVRRSPIRDKQGRALYTLREKRRTVGEVLNIVRNSLAKSPA